ncbi:MAG: hypothetical protein ACFFG0_04090 [Candidatus Thorarchaeota archaeon]
MKTLISLTIIFGLLFFATGYKIYKTNQYNANNKDIIYICTEKSNNDQNLFRQCLRNQIDAMLKIKNYLQEVYTLDAYKLCFDYSTDSKHRTDMVELANCLDLGKPKNSI